MMIPPEIFDKLEPDVDRVLDLVVGAFEGQEIPNGAIILGLGIVIGLTLNERMPGKDKPDLPDMKDVLPYLEVGMEIGRDMKIGRVQ